VAGERAGQLQRLAVGGVMVSDGKVSPGWSLVMVPWVLRDRLEVSSATSQIPPVASPSRRRISAAADASGVIRSPAAWRSVKRSCRARPMASGSWSRIHACMAVSTDPGR
jgi:hypothetical protein